MSSEARRRRASSAALRNENLSPISSPIILRLRSLLDSLPSRSSNDASQNSTEAIEKQAEALREVRLILVDSSHKHGRVKDDFRRLCGFEAIMDVSARLSGIHQSLRETETQEPRVFLDLVKALLDVLSEATFEHAGNCKYFASHAGEDKWSILEQDLARVDLFTSHVELTQATIREQTRLFSLLFAFAFRDESASNLIKAEPSGDVSASAAQGPEEEKADLPEKVHADNTHVAIEARIKRCADAVGPLWTPEAVFLIVKLWTHLFPRFSSTSESPAQHLSSSILVALIATSRSSEWNTCLMSRTGIFPLLLGQLLKNTRTKEETHCLNLLCLCLSDSGVGSVKEVLQLSDAAHHGDNSASLLSKVLHRNRRPPHFHFDLSLHGFASLELSELDGQFPPSEPALGYTLMCWICIEEFHNACHTTILGAFDESQTCFLLLYFERDSRQLVLQTSVTSSRPSVRFKSMTFVPNRWYHIAIVHRRPRTDGKSRAALFVDGEFLEQVKCDYPAAPPNQSNKPRRTATSATPPTQRPGRIQAFIGTPRDLSPRLGHGMLKSKWNIASMYIFSDALPDDLLFVYKNLGPFYQANFQDSLGSFQTYQASGKLNLRNESLNPGNAENSVISQAIKGRASRLVDESKILLSMSCCTVFSADSLKSSWDPRLNGASHRGREQLQNFLLAGAPGVALNAAKSRIRDALVSASGAAVYTGGVVCNNTFGIDDLFWQAAGCVPLCLNLVYHAQTEDDIERALRVCFEIVRGNWRNSEAFEKENGFAILAWILRRKLVKEASFKLRSPSIETAPSSENNTKPFSLKLLELVLRFTGYDVEHPERAILYNPLAYRALIVDTDIWRSSEPRTQHLYYEHLSTLASECQHKDFNIRRLSRMRLVKRFIDTLKDENINQTTFSELLKAFKLFLLTVPSADIYRSLALYITYAVGNSPFNSISGHNLKKPRSVSSHASLRLSTVPRRQESMPSNGAQKSGGEILSNFDLGVGILEMFAGILLEDADSRQLKKFATTVTNKWLLNLLLINHPRVVRAASLILARLMISHGPSYIQKFEEHTRGFLILKTRLRQYHTIPAIWQSCLAVCFGLDVEKINLEVPFRPNDFLDKLLALRKMEIAVPAMFPVLTALIEYALSTESSAKSSTSTTRFMRPQGLEAGIRGIVEPPKEQDMLTLVLEFLTLAHGRLQNVRDYLVSSNTIRELLKALMASCQQSDLSSPSESLYKMTDPSGGTQDAISLDSPTTVPSGHFHGAENTVPSPRLQANALRRRHSSFVLIDNADSRKQLEEVKRNGSNYLTELESPAVSFDGSGAKSLIKLLVAIFVDQVLDRKDFTGLGLYIKAPIGSSKVRAVLNTFLMSGVIGALEEELTRQPERFQTTTALLNVCRFATQLYEAIMEGWFLDGELPLVRLTSSLLDHLRQGSVQQLKAVRLCSPSLSTMLSTMRRASVRLLAAGNSTVESSRYLSRLLDTPGWRELFLLSEDEDDDEISGPIFCAILQEIIAADQKLITPAVNLLVEATSRRPEDFTATFTETANKAQLIVFNDLLLGLQGDTAKLEMWLAENNGIVAHLVHTCSDRVLKPHLEFEEESGRSGLQARTVRRRERLEQWHLEDLAEAHTITENNMSASYWIENICVSEHRKLLRTRQDQQESLEYLETKFRKHEDTLSRLRPADPPPKTIWQLDECEARDRMRPRLAPSRSVVQVTYEPKRTKTLRKSTMTRQPLTVKTEVPRAEITASPTVMEPGSFPRDGSVNRRQSTPFGADAAIAGDEFEVVSTHDVPGEEEEDKNRKVMRSLDRGEHVLNVYNMSRIIGLEADEGLAIIGKKSLYLVDGLFQRSDGEVVSVEHAPPEERDHYTQIISGQEVDVTRTRQRTQREPVRSWSWSDILSFSKRQFLTRAVAIEVFFRDGRSFLLTASDQEQRDSFYADLATNTSEARSKTKDETNDADWRTDLLKNPQESSSRFSQVFQPITSNPITRRWMRGEMSNFHYLMLINSLAGRTFNDLTQYPVFPWVLADYTSEELDLTNPRSFRDLTRPMGCQNLERAEAFKERYRSFAEMDEETPPFHYGTHYSSAMIVTSFLIRLEPFVRSHVLLQGGSFDHADRLFYSVEKAWLSASKETFSDVRELIPEFFYLPEFLTNVNGYDFGRREGTGELVNDVKLPPWAKGDPHIFIAKHREALESPYVSQNLQSWIDLVFGFKQRGEAALEATNVFHHLSYPGAKNLDKIEDQHERAATIGIIHNFGQTPRQIFFRPHERREDLSDKAKRLKKSLDSLHRLPSPVLELPESISHMQYTSKQLTASGPCTILVPPAHRISVDWANVDRSLRFYSADRRKLLGIFEQLHQDSISTVLFADSRLLITGGTDCVASAWKVSIDAVTDTVDLTLRSSLFGHRSPICALAVSRAFGTLLSASTDGTVILWDLARFEHVRGLHLPARIDHARISNISGRLLLCAGRRATLANINGHTLVDQDLCSPDHADDRILSCAFYEHPGNAWLGAEILVTGHRRGVVQIWDLVVRQNGQWALELLSRFSNAARSSAPPLRDPHAALPGVTCLLPAEGKLFVGDEDGRAYEYDAVR